MNEHEITEMAHGELKDAYARAMMRYRRLSAQGAHPAASSKLEKAGELAYQLGQEMDRRGFIEWQ